MTAREIEHAADWQRLKPMLERGERIPACPNCQAPTLQSDTIVVCTKCRMGVTLKPEPPEEP